MAEAATSGQRQRTPIWIPVERCRVLKDLQCLRIALIGDSHMQETYAVWNLREIRLPSGWRPVISTFFGSGEITAQRLLHNLTYVQQAIDWHPNIAVIQVGSNDLDVKSHALKDSYAVPILQMWRNFEDEGILTFVVALPSRFRIQGSITSKEYGQKSRAVNKRLRRDLPEGRIIVLTRNLYHEDAYRGHDGIHFKKEGYKAVAALVRAQIENLMSQMGRRNKKPQTLDGWLPYDPIMDKYSSRLLAKVLKYCDYITASEMSSDDHDELERYVYRYKDWIWNDLKKHRNAVERNIVSIESDCCSFSIISYETFKDIMENDKLPLMDDIMDHESLVYAFLTAETMKEGFDNVLVYTRFLNCCLYNDEDTGDTSVRDKEGRYYMKRYVQINHRFKKWGITVSEVQGTTKHVWDIPGKRPDLLSQLSFSFEF